MGKQFKNINEELERMKTLMYETDNLVLNKKRLNESESIEDETPENSDETSVEMDEQDKDFKTKRSSFKVAKVSDINTMVRGGAAKFDTYKIKGTGVTQLFDASGKMTPEGMELMKKSGLNLPAGQIVMRINKKDGADTDKVFFQVVPASELSIVTKDKEIADLTAQDLDKLATEKSKVVPAPAPTPSPTPSPVSLKDSDIIYHKFSELKLNTIDATKNFNNAGYKSVAGATYFVNKDNKDAYRVSKDGIVTAIFKRKGKQVGESFNMNMLFVNPLLFESVVTEQATVKNYEYQCVGDCRGQDIMTPKFTDVVDATLEGREWAENTPTPTPGPGPSPSPVKEGGDWANYPCITKNSVIKKVDHPKFGVVYEDAANRYFANGRFMDLKTNKMGNYKCEGEKIVSDKGGQGQAQTPKYRILTDADLVGQQGILSNLAQAPSWLLAATSPTIVGVLGAGFLKVMQMTNRRGGVKGVVDALDGFVTSSDLAYVLMTVTALKDAFYLDEVEGGYVPATKAFLELYSEDEGGDDLIADVESVGTTTLPTGSEKLKQRIIKTIQNQLATPIPAELEKSGESGVS